jgi:hypothetical protein
MPKKLKYMMYEHHGKEVWVREDLKGKHTSLCLCYVCSKFYPGEERNCEIAKSIYENCVKFNLVTPIFECPNFEFYPTFEVLSNPTLR